jgi:hypothetical protein
MASTGKDQQQPSAAAKFAALRVATTLNSAQLAGLMTGKKEKRVSGRAHEQLFRAAAERSGLNGSELIEYALAKVALEDDFADKLLGMTGAVSRDIDLEF